MEEDPVLQLKRFVFTGSDSSPAFYRPFSDTPAEDWSFYSGGEGEGGTLPLDDVIPQIVASNRIEEALVALSAANAPGVVPFQLRPTVLYVLARLCALGTKTEEEKVAAAAARSAVLNLVNRDEPQEFLVFFYFFKKIATKNKMGVGGRGMRNIAAKWYNSQTINNLFRGSKKHFDNRDVIRLLHVSADTIEMKVFFTYLTHGMKRATEQFASQSGARPHLDYLEKVDELRHCKDAAEAADLVADYSFDIARVPTDLLGDERVWHSCLPWIPYREVLQYLKRLAMKGFLKPDNSVAQVVARVLCDQHALNHGKVQPVELLKVLRHSETEWAYPPKKGEDNIDPVFRTAKATCPTILEALKNMISVSYQNLRPLDRSVLVCVDGRRCMTTSQSWGCFPLMALETVAVTVLSLANAEAARITLCTFAAAGAVKIIDFQKTDSIDELQNKILESETGKVDLLQPVEWATTNLSKFDAFVCLTGSHTHCHQTRLATALKRYRETVGDPGVKWLACAASTKSLNTASEEDPLTMDIAGFDVAVPQMIASFVRGDF